MFQKLNRYLPESSWAIVLFEFYYSHSRRFHCLSNFSEGGLIELWKILIITFQVQIFIKQGWSFFLLKPVSAIFINFLLFHQMITFQNLRKMFFISSKKLFSFLRYSNFCLFSLPFHTFQTQKDKRKWNNLWCHELAYINLQM